MGVATQQGGQAGEGNLKWECAPSYVQDVQVPIYIL